MNHRQTAEEEAGSGFSRREAIERHSFLDTRSRGETLPQGSDALFHGARPDGEPKRPCRRLSEPSRWARGTDRGPAHDRAARRRPQTIAPGADKAYDAEDFVNEPRSMKVTPQVAQNTAGRSSAIDGRTTQHAGYAICQRIRKRIEEAFGWIKTIAGQGKTKFRGRDRVGWAFTFASAAYNLARLPKLLAEQA
jgi:hypothetical protein